MEQGQPNPQANTLRTDRHILSCILYSVVGGIEYQVLGFWVPGSGFGVPSLRWFQVLGSGFGVLGLGFWV
jgi:hypothetical protein